MVFGLKERVVKTKVNLIWRVKVDSGGRVSASLGQENVRVSVPGTDDDTIFAGINGKNEREIKYGI